MCSISHEYKAIYFHIPKTGGLYIQRLLEKFYGFETIYFTHESHDNFTTSIPKNYRISPPNLGFLFINKQGILRYYMSSNKYAILSGMTPEKWKEYYKFTFVRNPYDKLVSAWKYCDSKNDIKYNLKDFIDTMDETKRYPGYSHAFITQTDHLLNLEETINFDYIGRFENLNEELVTILLKIGINPIKHIKTLSNNIKLNSNKIPVSYIDLYDDKLIEFVNTFFDKDFINFNFTKCVTMEELIENSKLYIVSDKEFKLKNQKILSFLISNHNIYSPPSIENGPS